MFCFIHSHAPAFGTAFVTSSLSPWLNTSMVCWYLAGFRICGAAVVFLTGPSTQKKTRPDHSTAAGDRENLRGLNTGERVTDRSPMRVMTGIPGPKIGRAHV